MSKCVASFQNRFPYSCILMLHQNHAPSESARETHRLYMMMAFLGSSRGQQLVTLAFGIHVKLLSIHACAWEKHLKVTLVIT